MEMHANVYNVAQDKGEVCSVPWSDATPGRRMWLSP